MNSQTLLMAKRGKPQAGTRRPDTPDEVLPAELGQPLAVDAGSESRAHTAEVATRGMAASAVVGLLSMVLLALLAFDPFKIIEPTPADKITLLFLGFTAAVLFWTPLRRNFESADAATFALAAAFFIIYGLARRAGPDEGWALRFSALPDDVFTISWAARIALAGALISAAMSRQRMSLFVRAALGACLIIGLFSLGIFLFLSRMYPVGATEVLDPTPLVHLLMQLIEYGAVAILCGVVGADLTARRIALKVLPLLLLALWARHQFAAAPIEEDEA
jgi:hypothetical protein